MDILDPSLTSGTHNCQLVGYRLDPEHIFIPVDKESVNRILLLDLKIFADTAAAE